MAHRDALTLCVEITLPSFRAALEAGADVLEMDVRTSADGASVVFHDDTVDRVTHGHGAVQAFTLQQLRALPLREVQAGRAAPNGIATLTEVLEAFPESPLNIELKAVDVARVPEVMGWLRRRPRSATGAPQVLLTSEDSRTSRAIAQAVCGEATLGMSRRGVLQVLVSAYLGLGLISRLRGRACQIPKFTTVAGLTLPVMTARLGRCLQRMDCPIHVWWDKHGMIDDETRFSQAYALGADGVFTNNLGHLKALCVGDLGCRSKR